MERLANSLAAFLATQLDLDSDRREQISYGFILFLHSAATLVAIAFLATCFGVLPEAILIALVASTLRRASGGAHLSSPLGCTLASSLGFTFGALSARHFASVSLSWSVIARVVTVTVLAGAAFLAVWRYAPVAAATRPLRHEHAERLRHLSRRLAAFYVLVIAVAAAYGFWWVMPVLVGLWLQCLTLTPAGHRVVRCIDGSHQRSI